jgi:two-component system, chemotaxis family, chemotaxis protein CheY
MPFTVLLVDDSATTRSIIKVYLTGLDVTFREASDSTSALAVLRGQRVDLMILDVNMPGMDGASLVEHLRSSNKPNHQNLKIVLLTGDKSDKVRVRGVTVGANELVFKPVTSEAMREAVLRWLPGAQKGPSRPNVVLR